MFKQTGLLELLDRLKENGWDYPELAIVAWEWRTFVLTKWFNPNQKTTLAIQTLQDISNNFHKALLELKEPSDLIKYRKIKKYLVCLKEDQLFKEGRVIDNDSLFNSVDKNMERELLMEKASSIVRSRESLNILHQKGFDGSDSRKIFIDTVIEPIKETEYWKHIRDNITDKEEFNNFIRKNMQNDYTTNKEQLPDIKVIYERLENICKTCDIASISLSPFDIDNPQALWDIVGLLERIHLKWQDFTDKSMGLGILDLSVGSSYTGSSGLLHFYSKSDGMLSGSIELNHLLGLEAIQVLAHELWHMHEYALSKFSSDCGPSHNHDSFKPISEENIAEITNLFSGISGLKDDLSYELITGLNDNMLNKWCGFLPKCEKELSLAINTWKLSGNDSEFIEKVSGLFDRGAFYESKTFRSVSMLTELKILEKLKTGELSNTNLIIDFFNEFEKIKSETSIDIETEIYEEGYLISQSEVFARSFQRMFKDSKNEDDLLYCGFHDLSETKKMWREFFSSEEIQKRYNKLEGSVDQARTVNTEELDINRIKSTRNKSSVKLPLCVNKQM